MAIRAIERATVEKIASGQVITDLASAIKELIENGLDATASSIEVTFYREGLDGFEVADNGHGIQEADLRTLGQPHCTSKLDSFEGIEGLQSLGFRGEAFHSICTLSSSVVVTSRTVGGELGLQATYNSRGQLSAIKPCAASQGTRVRVTGLFHDYPVRLADWKKNAKRVFSKTLRVVQSYAIGFPSVKFRCINQDGGKGQSVLISTCGGGSMISVFSELFGLNGKHMCALPTIEQDDMIVEGIVGLPDAPRRSTPDRQFFFINGHPSDQKHLQKACNEVYRSYEISDYPIIALSIRLGSGECDVNLTPDKRAITVFKEKEIAQVVREAVARCVFERIELKAKIDTYSQTTISAYTTTSTSQALSLELEEDPQSAQKEPETNIKMEQHSVSSDLNGDLTSTQSQTSAHQPDDCCKSGSTLAQLAEPVSDSLSKEDFLSMQIIGQFNCGFILTRLDRPDTDITLMYIIDQHAADERFRLETLERLERVSEQPLMRPKRFSVSLEDAIVIEGNRERIEELGFGVRLVSQGQDGLYELYAVPQIASVTLELEDFLELVHYLKENRIVNGLSACERVSSVLASKACRSAIMIGAPLSFPQMSTVVKNLSGLKKPWICAHGRPTVRLLYSSKRQV